MANETESVTNPPLATIAGIGQHEGQSVTLRGWLYNLRASGKLLFPRSELTVRQAAELSRMRRENPWPRMRRRFAIALRDIRQRV